MQTRNADSVLPEPVVAATSVSSPLSIAGQAPSCGGVGPSGNRRSNHVRMAGWKLGITAYDSATLAVPTISSILLGIPATEDARSGTSAATEASAERKRATARDTVSP